MRILELEIINTRGIPHAVLKPQGKNLVIWGANGSGKSAVVDSIDFLLTGRISRLTGKGTGVLSLPKHGPHIDHTPADAIVRAVVCLHGSDRPVELQRCMAKPNKLEILHGTGDDLKQVLGLAEREQHVLTRREILKYVTAEGSTRAEEIQDLLNLSSVEAMRKAFVRAKNDLEKEHETAKTTLEKAKAGICVILGFKTFSADNVLAAINQNRAIVQGAPVEQLASTQIKTGLQIQTVKMQEKTVNVSMFERACSVLKAAIAQDSVDQANSTIVALSEKVAAIKADPSLLRALALQQLTKIGIGLLDDSGQCPLCEYIWPAEELRTRLMQRVDKASAADAAKKAVADQVQSIVPLLQSTSAAIKEVCTTARSTAFSKVDFLDRWSVDMDLLLGSLEKPFDNDNLRIWTRDGVAITLCPVGCTAIVDELLDFIKGKYPASTPEQTAWDTLTRLEVNLKNLEQAQAELNAAALSAGRAVVLLDEFQKARDDVLNALYNSISERFVALYRDLHGADEKDFTAVLKHEGASLDFEVDFYGRGPHPPHALHSEGHQDSMGLCLYLALSERLTAGLIDLVILDDVVMSVDANHRRELCRLLSKNFPDKQFLITTHDRTWAHQLRTEGIVGSAGLLEFFGWNVDTGPQLNCETMLWDEIATCLGNGKVQSAAHLLRRGLEQFSADACGSLAAHVEFKANNRWELGDLLPAAIGQYRILLKKAKNSAQSWGDDSAMAKLIELDTIAGQICQRTNHEQWAINTAVHYNNWESFSPNDFKPVVEAFQDLHAQFFCSSCGALIYMTKQNNEINSLRCSCGKINWNLVQRKK